MNAAASHPAESTGHLTKADRNEAMRELVAGRISRAMLAFRTGLPSGLIMTPEPREAEIQAREKLQRPFNRMES